MIPAPLPMNEADRLRALRELAILDSNAEERFDRLTLLAQDLFQTPIALVSLVDSDRQWFKSRQGLAATETAREVADKLCVALQAHEADPFDIGAISLSVGLAEGIEAVEPLLHRADAAMYDAKRSGKGRVVVAPPAV